MKRAGRHARVYDDDIRAMRAAGLSPSARWTWTIMLSYAGPDRGSVAASLTTLQADTGIPRRSIIRAIDELALAGWIVREETPDRRRNRTGVPGVYRLTSATVALVPVPNVKGTSAKREGNQCHSFLKPCSGIDETHGSDPETDPETEGEIIAPKTEEEINAPTPPPASPSDPNHNEVEAQIVQLADLHRRLWSLPEAQNPSGDDRSRIGQALALHGLEGCQRALRGHRAMASGDTSQRGRDLRHAFPQARVGGERRSDVLDVGRLIEHMNRCPPRPAPPPRRPEMDGPPVTPEQMAASRELIRELLNGSAPQASDRDEVPF